MSVLDSDSKPLATIIEDPGFDEAQVAAAAFLARYNGRTLDAYRYDLRTFFQWAADADLTVLEAKRPHIELYRTAMEQKGLAPSTIDRRLSTVCGFYRVAHIDGRVTANPAQYVRRPKFNGLRASEACGTNIEDLAQGNRTLRIMGKGSKPAVIPLVPRAARTIDLAIGEPTAGAILRRKDGARLDRRTAHRWVRSIGKQAGLSAVYPHMLRSAFIMAALDAGVPLRDVQIAARHADPRTTTDYDRRRENFHRHAA
jgi:site-specific recombinase XerD